MKNTLLERCDYYMTDQQKRVKQLKELENKFAILSHERDRYEIEFRTIRNKLGEIDKELTKLTKELLQILNN
jgi:chromosome segregation ATPase